MSTENVAAALIKYKSKIPEKNELLFKNHLEKATDGCWAELMGLTIKSKVATLLLSIFLGALGVDRFYLGDIQLGILKLGLSIAAAIFMIFNFTILSVILNIVRFIWYFIDIFLTYSRAKEKNYLKLCVFLTDHSLTCSADNVVNLAESDISNDDVRLQKSIREERFNAVENISSEETETVDSRYVESERDEKAYGENLSHGGRQVKKIVAAVVMAVVVVFTFITYNKTDEVLVGVGDGLSANIGTLDEFSKALSDFDDNFKNGGYVNKESENNTRLSAYALAEETSLSAKYKSATMYLFDSAYENFSYTLNGVSREYNYEIQKEMSLYITESAVYYISEGILGYNSKISTGDDSESHSGNLSFYCELYRSSNIFMVKFNKFNFINDGVMNNFPEEIRGVWIDLSDAENDMLSSLSISEFDAVNNANFSYFSLLCDYVSQYNTTAFTKSGSVYILDESYIDGFIKKALNIYSANSLSTDYTGEFSIDLTDGSYPKVNINYANKSNPIKDDNGTSIGSYKMREVVEYGFTNFNNTIITPPSDFSAISSSEFIEIMEDL